MTEQHKCAEFTYDKDYGAEIIADPIVYPLSDFPRAHDGALTSDYWQQDIRDASEEWDRISVHGYEFQEGITSGHVYKFVDGGVLIGDVVIMW